MHSLQVTAMKFFIGTKENEEGVEEVESTDEDEGEENSKTLKEVRIFVGRLQSVKGATWLA